jgi:hypothetical protein
MTCPRVLQVWFRGDFRKETKWRGLSAPRFKVGADPNAVSFLAGIDEIDTVFGVPLWVAADGGHVFRWAIEPCTCTDERWTLFGPFQDTEDALRQLEGIRRNVEARGGTIEGWRLFNEHCVIEVFRGNVGTAGIGKPDGRPRAWPRQMWTDG